MGKTETAFCLTPQPSPSVKEEAASPKQAAVATWASSPPPSLQLITFHLRPPAHCLTRRVCSWRRAHPLPSLPTSPDVSRRWRRESTSSVALPIWRRAQQQHSWRRAEGLLSSIGSQMGGIAMGRRRLVLLPLLPKMATTAAESRRCCVRLSGSRRGLTARRLAPKRAI